MVGYSWHAPMTMGMAVDTLISSAPTSPMMMDVEVEELWTSTVARMPIITPDMGLSTTSNILALSFPPRSLKPVPIRPRQTKKSHMRYHTKKKIATFTHWTPVAGTGTFVTSCGGRP